MENLIGFSSTDLHYFGLCQCSGVELYRNADYLSSSVFIPCFAELLQCLFDWQNVYRSSPVLEWPVSKLWD